MKTTNTKYRTLTLAAGILVAILTLTTSAMAKDTTGVAASNNYEMEYELLKDYAIDFNEITVVEETTIKVFNSNDELVAEGITFDGETSDKNLQSLINRSDLLMDFNNISYYRINK